MSRYTNVIKKGLGVLAIYVFGIVATAAILGYAVQLVYAAIRHIQ